MHRLNHLQQGTSIVGGRHPCLQHPIVTSRLTLRPKASGHPPHARVEPVKSTCHCGDLLPQPVPPGYVGEFMQQHRPQPSRRPALASGRKGDDRAPPTPGHRCAGAGLAFHAADEGPDSQPPREGVDQLHNAFLDVLTKSGLGVVDQDGVPFDPTVHDAVMHEPGDGADGPSVAEVLRTGYQWNGRTLRAAMVRVKD